MNNKQYFNLPPTLAGGTLDNCTISGSQFENPFFKFLGNNGVITRATAQATLTVQSEPVDGGGFESRKISVKAEDILIIMRDFDRDNPRVLMKNGESMSLRIRPSVLPSVQFRINDPTANAVLYQSGVEPVTYTRCVIMASVTSIEIQMCIEYTFF